MNNLIYRRPVTKEEVPEGIKKFIEYFEAEEVPVSKVFEAEDLIYDVVYWAEPVHDSWSANGEEIWYYDPCEQRCQKTYLIDRNGNIEKVDEFEFYELQIWKVFEKYPQKLLKTEYIVVAEINYNSATIYYTKNTTAVQNKIFGIVLQCQQIKQKMQKLLAG